MFLLSTRLTVKEAVSQLTNFYKETLAQQFVDRNTQTVIINLSIDTGLAVLNDYSLILEPRFEDKVLEGLRVQLFQNSYTDDHEPERVITLYSANLGIYSMTVSQLYKCALHLSGDYIKFMLTGRE